MNALSGFFPPHMELGKGLLKTFVTLRLDNSDINIYFHKCPSARPVYQVDLENYVIKCCQAILGLH